MRTAFWPAVQRWVIVSAKSKIIRQLTGAAFISPGRLKFISFSIFSFIFCYFIHFYFFTPLQELQGTSWWSEFALERLLLGLAEEVKKHRLCDFNRLSFTLKSVIARSHEGH